MLNSQKSALVTGADGFIGSHLVEMLVVINLGKNACKTHEHIHVHSRRYSPKFTQQIHAQIHAHIFTQQIHA